LSHNNLRLGLVCLPADSLDIASAHRPNRKHCFQQFLYLGFEVLTAVVMKSTTFWDIMLCSSLPYGRSIFNRISKMLSWHNIKSVGLPPRKISSFLRMVKGNLGLKTLGVYSIPCECGQVYTGQTGRSIDTSDIAV
jgi:hypothetical protein